MRPPAGLVAGVYWVGCAGAPAAHPELAVEILPAPPGLGGVRRLHVVADRPVAVTATLWDGADVRELRFAGTVDDALLPLLGLHPSTEAAVLVEAVDDAGRSAVQGPFTFETDPLPERFPDLEVLALDPARVEPGWLLAVVRVPDSGVAHLVVLDALARPVWWCDREPQFGGEVRRSPRGTFVGIAAGAVHEIDVLGDVVRSILPDGEALHHELVELPDGTFWSLRTLPYDEPAYPIDPDDPLGPTAPAVLEDHEVVRIDGTGAVLTAWRLSDVLDTARVSEQSFDRTASGRLDWAHANGLAATEDGGVIVSARHQDALVRLGPDGALRWILGDPAGWREPWASSVLAPDGDVTWAYHQHAPAIGPDGEVAVYDNHNRGSTLYEPPPEAPERSRAAAFVVDEAAFTVADAWERTETTTGALWTPANGDVDPQPATGNWLVDFGFVTREDDVPNADLGRGARSIRLLEYAPDGAVVLDVRLSGQLALEPMGWQAFRAERIPALYPDGVLVPPEEE